MVDNKSLQYVSKFLGGVSVCVDEASISIDAMDAPNHFVSVAYVAHDGRIHLCMDECNRVAKYAKSLKE